MDTESGRRSRYALAAIVVVVVGAIAGAAVVSVLRGPDRLDPATPEGVAQAFFEAVLDGDDASARALAAGSLEERCFEYRRLVLDGGEESTRVLLSSSRVDADRAVVEVDVERISNPSPFGFDSYTVRSRLVLERAAAGWVVVEAGWPFFCEEGGP